MANGTPKKIAKGLKAQFFDRSTENLYRKVTPTAQSGSLNKSKERLKTLLFPASRYKAFIFAYLLNDPITLLYESITSGFNFERLPSLENTDLMGAFLEATVRVQTAKISINFSIPSAWKAIIG